MENVDIINIPRIININYKVDSELYISKHHWNNSIIKTVRKEVVLIRTLTFPYDYKDSCIIVGNIF